MRPLRLTIAASLFVPTLAAAQGSAPDSLTIAERRLAVERGLRFQVSIRGELGMQLEERMAVHRVPGVSIAVINGGRVEWARGYGTKRVGAAEPVNATTLFQAASISKPLAALAALRLVREGRFGLDDEVNRLLTSWQIPENDYTRERKVTVRDLLAHSAGLTNTIGAYAPDAGTLPTLVEALDGTNPLKPRPVRVEFVPGSRFEYSGGGFSVLQLLLEDVTRKRFSDLMREVVLAPLSMFASSFEQPLPAIVAGAAASAHATDGTTVAGRWRVLPEAAAGGLWSTPSDLALFVLELQAANAGQPARIVDSTLARAMLTLQNREWGLGIDVNGEGRARHFVHTGWNLGFRSIIIGFTETGQGAVIMTNGNSTGVELISEILRSIGRTYAWPAFRDHERTRVTVDPALYPAFTGKYRVEARLEFTITTERSRLYISGGPFGRGSVELHPESEETYFPLTVDVSLTFQRNDQGKVSGMLVRPPAGAARLAVRVGDAP
jgi:CubicO group peptidase (beta-lactamase class C family)